MIQTLKNAWRVEEIRKKLLFTLIILLIFRIGNAIPVPYVNTAALQSYFTSLQNTVLGLLNVMSGGAFSQATIFALSIQPYINASIIIQLLCIAIPALERMSKEEGEEGKKKIASITRYSTVAIALLQGFAYYMLIKNNGLIVAEARDSFWAAIVIVLTFTSGSALIMWLGEQITEYGIGNGISMILFAGIISLSVNENNHIVVKGPKGTLERTLIPQMKVEIDNGVIHVSRPNDSKENKSYHGLTRTLIDNMVVGVTHGFEKKLEINGVGYRASKEDKKLVMNLGYSHPIVIPETEDIQIDVPDANHIVIKGIDKQKVGQFAAEVRGKRPPEPYKGKGVKYDYETIRRKEGKTGAK